MSPGMLRLLSRLEITPPATPNDWMELMERLSNEPTIQDQLEMIQHSCWITAVEAVTTIASMPSERHLKMDDRRWHALHQILQRNCEHFGANYLTGKQYLEGGDYSNAVFRLTAACAADQNAWQAFFLASVGLMSLNRYEEAYEKCLRANKLAPSNQEVQATLEDLQALKAQESKFDPFKTVGF